MAGRVRSSSVAASLAWQRTGRLRWRPPSERRLGASSQRVDARRGHPPTSRVQARCVRQQRPAADHVVGQRAQPLAQRPVLAALRAGPGSGELDEVGRLVGVAAGQRVPDGVLEQAVGGVPVAGGAVQAAGPGPGRSAVSRARSASAKRWW